MPSSADLVSRSGDLKRALVDFAQQPRFERELDRVLRRRFRGRAAVDEAAFVDVLDVFVLQHRLPDGRTVVEHFVAEHPELTEEERAMLLGWRAVVEGIFEVQRREGEALIVVNLVDELTYRLRSNRGPAVFARMRPRSFLISRIVPVPSGGGDEWLLSGISRTLPAAERASALRWAADIASQHPALVFRNSAKVAQGWELQREERRHFISFFGSDEVVLPGRELTERMRAYGRFRTHEVRDAAGKSAAERSREVYGVDPPDLDFAPPPELSELETVGVVYDEVDGLHFLSNFGRVQRAFADPDRLSDRDDRDAVRGYLKEPSIPPMALRRLAERDPERASRVFRRVLRQADFAWERDGEALLRRHKASYFAQPVLPSVTPITRPLARAQLAAPDGGGDAAGRRRRTPGARRRTARRSGRSR